MLLSSNSMLGLQVLSEEMWEDTKYHSKVVHICKQSAREGADRTWLACYAGIMRPDARSETHESRRTTNNNARPTLNPHIQILET
jgi:hypothetical protein